MPLATLLVEDNATIRAHLIPALSDLGNAVVIATAETETGAKAWLEGFTGHLDLAVVDLFLAEGSGHGVLSAVRKKRPLLPVLILTNYATEAIRGRCLAAGATGVFDKSTELDEFMAYCRSLREGQPEGLAT